MPKKMKTKKPKPAPIVVNPKGLMTRAEVAKYVGVGVQYLCNLAKAGKFQGNVPTRFGTETLYTKKHVDKWRTSIRGYVENVTV